MERFFTPTEVLEGEKPNHFCPQARLPEMARELHEGDTLRRLWPTAWEPGPFWWWGAEPRDRREGG